MSLELAAMRWLWLEQNCLVVLEERTPKYGMGLPDVLGVTPGRYLTEIEIKRSRADFQNDFHKPHRIIRGVALTNKFIKLPEHPRQLYYMMPPDLAEKLKDQIPEWAGLMTTECSTHAKVIKKAPVNKDSTKLDLKSCARLSRMMTAHMMGYVINNSTIRDAFRNNSDFDFTEWIKAENGTYQI